MKLFKGILVAALGVVSSPVLASHDDDQALLEAAANNDIPEAQRLIAAGADVHYFGYVDAPYLACSRPVSALALAAAGSYREPNVSYVGMLGILVAAGADVNESRDGCSALAFSADYSDHVDHVRFLLDHGADPNGISSESSNPFFHISVLNYAVYQNRPKIVAELLARGARQNDHGWDVGSTIHFAFIGAGHNHPPHYGCFPESKELLQLLLAAGAPVSEPDQIGRTVLAKAAHACDGEVVSLLLNAGAEVDQLSSNPDGKELWTPLLFALYGDRPDNARLLLNAGANPTFTSSNHGVMPIINAACLDNLDLTEDILARGADVNVTGWSYLDDTWPKGQGYRRVAYEAVSPLGCAAEYSDMPMLQRLIDAGADTNLIDRVDGETPIMRAVTSFRDESAISATVTALISAGADITLANQSYSVLHNALDHNPDFPPNLLERLIQLGAPVEAITTLRGKPINLVLGEANSAVGLARVLLRHASDLSTPTPWAGVTPLMAATKDGNPSLIREVLRRGVDVNVVDRDGTTALMIAASLGSLQVVELLCSAGADKHLQDHYGKTAAGRAYDSQSGERYQDIVDFLSQGCGS
jgi:ankyrin repeat protein